MKCLSNSCLFIACLLAGVAEAQTKVIFVGRGSAADPAIQSYLENRYGVTNVTYQTTEPVGTVKLETLHGFDVAVLSSTPDSSRYRNILHESTTPIVNLESAVATNNTGEFSITTGLVRETETGPHAVTITGTHPITAGFAINSVVTLTTGPARMWFCTGAQAPGSVSLAHDDDTSTNLFLSYIEVGDTLLNTGRAPCRRVMFGTTDHTFNLFTPDGKKLFGQAVDWAASGCCAQTSNYGTGLAGLAGIPTLTTNATPQFLSNIDVLASNSSGSTTAALVLIGQQQTSVPFLGGALLVNPILQVSVAIPAGGLVLPVTIPDLSALCTIAPSLLRFQVQVLQLDSAAVGGVSMTPGMQLRTGM